MEVKQYTEKHMAGYDITCQFGEATTNLHYPVYHMKTLLNDKITIVSNGTVFLCVVADILLLPLSAPDQFIALFVLLIFESHQLQFQVTKVDSISKS